MSPERRTMMLATFFGLAWLTLLVLILDALMRKGGMSL